MNKDIFVVCAIPFNTVWFNKPSKDTKITIAFDNRKDANSYAEKKHRKHLIIITKLKKLNWKLKMLRFQIIDCFGDCIRKFATLKEAKAFRRLRKDCKIVEFDLHEILGDCLL